MAGRVELYASRIGSSSGSTSQSVPINSGSVNLLPWHLSVFAFGYEISYGNDGISVSEPSRRDGTSFPDETVHMGTTTRTREQFLRFVDDLRENWTADNYNALTHNCIMFVQEILNFLEISEIIPYRYTQVAGNVHTGATAAGFGIFAWMLGKVVPYASGSSGSSS